MSPFIDTFRELLATFEEYNRAVSEFVEELPDTPVAQGEVPTPGTAPSPTKEAIRSSVVAQLAAQHTMKETLKDISAELVRQGEANKAAEKAAARSRRFTNMWAAIAAVATVATVVLAVVAVVAH